MSIFSLIEKFALVINSLSLLFFGVRYLRELGRHRAEFEKLRLEIEALKREAREANELISRPSEGDIERLIIKPLVEHLEKGRSNRSGFDSMERLQAELTVPGVIGEIRDLHERFMVDQDRMFQEAAERMRRAIDASLRDVQFELRVSGQRSPV